MEEKQNQDIEFIKEKVKERPLNRKKLLKRTILTASMAVIFGLIACLTFLVLEPVFTNLLYPEEEPQQVELKEESINEEMRPEDMILEEETETEPPAILQQTFVEKVELELADYQRLHRLMYALTQQASEFMVTVIGVETDQDWFDNTYENQGQSAGMIVAENGKELLILTDYATIADVDSVDVVLFDGTQAEAELKGVDQETGFAIVSLPLESIGEKTRESMQTATLGGSGSSLLGSPVIALGRPLGTSASLVYGMVTSADTWETLADHNVRILTTDMTGSGSGVLINLSGQVVGILCPSQSAASKGTLLTAYGITDLRKIIEKLSNGQEIAHMGVLGTDVPPEVHEELGVPMGAFVIGIRMDSPAMQAGIQSGDVIVKLGTAEITSFADYQDAIMNLSPESTVTVKIMRQGVEEYQEMAVDVILGR